MDDNGKMFSRYALFMALFVELGMRERRRRRRPRGGWEPRAKHVWWLSGRADGLGR